MPLEKFIEHGSRAAQLAQCNLDADGIAQTVRTLLEGGGNGWGLSSGELRARRSVSSH